MARSLGAEVWQTDNLTAALEIARLNARANEVGGITRFTADWTRWTDDRLYDVILGSDILYERAMQGSVVSIFRRNLSPMALYYLRIQRGSNPSIYWHV